ncbi:2793_t:CDS:1, partial [Funneliformis caledonium]
FNFEIDDVVILQLFKLITHVRKHLKYLSFQIDKTIHVFNSLFHGLEKFWSNLTRYLKYLELRIVFDPINLESFG